MPLPIGSAACVHITAANQDLKVTLPGGAELAPNLPFGDFPGPLDVAKALLGQINTALSPLVPVFNVIDLGLSLFEFAKKAATLSIGDMIEALKKVASNADKLLSMVPQLSIPIMILNIVDMIIAMLNGIVSELNVLVQETERIAQAHTTATNLGNAEMSAILDCASENVTIQMQAFNAGLAPLNRLIGLINLLGALVPGFPTLPPLDDFSEDASEALEEITELLTTIQNIRNAIPL